MLEKFEQLMISEPVLRALNDMGFEEPTPIQQEAIPVAMSGKDMIGQAQTGTGKTAAFGLPVLERVDGNERHVQVVILSPTRELAIQVAEELNKMAQYTNITALPIYGGQDINRQFRALKKNPQIIVATPGRLMDHMDRGSIKFEDVKIVVLDEADEMLNMGFVDDINKILGAIPEDHQTLLFSATMPKAIRELAETYLTEPTLIRMKPTQVTMDLIEQYYIEVQDRQKFDVLCRLFDLQAPELAIIFTRTKRRVDEVTEALKKRGYMAEGIHGDLSQQKRDSVIRQFREGTIDILVATDVAARGIDIDDDWKAIMRQLNHAPHNRIVLYKGSLDEQVLGILRVREAFRLLLEKNEFTKETLLRAVDEVYFIPEGTPLKTQLANFRTKKERIGLVVDEYGDIKGLVTLEDILEEIVGDFTTTTAPTIEQEVVQQSDGSMIIEGSANLRDLNKMFGWELDTEDARTFNGLILEHLEDIPDEGTVCEIDGLRITILEVSDNMIKQAKVEKLAS